jgi:hypothetical protein
VTGAVDTTTTESFSSHISVDGMSGCERGCRASANKFRLAVLGKANICELHNPRSVGTCNRSLITFFNEDLGHFLLYTSCSLCRGPH